MKKIFFLLTVLCLGLVQVKAEDTDVSDIDNVLYLNPVTANVGTRCVLSVQMKNVDAITGYEFFLELPEGITFARDEDDFLLSSLSTARTTSKKTNFFDCTVTDEGLLHVLCSTTAADPTTERLYTFTGTDGEVCTVSIDIPSDFESGVYPIALTKIVLTPSAADKGYETDRIETTLTIEENDGRIHFDESASSLPVYTAGERANVAMARTIKANQWSTIVLPFTLTKAKAEAAFGSGVELAEFSGFVVDYGDDEDNVVPLGITINLSTYSMTNKKGMTGGKPFMIKTSKDITSFEADDVTLFRAVNNVDKRDEYDTPGTFTGTLVKSLIPTDGLFLSDNKFWYSTGLTNVKAFRCWFELGAVLDKETNFGARIMLHFDDETTGIGDASRLNDKCKMTNEMFDLQGRRVTDAQRGLYIMNGKKVVVK